MSHKEPDPNEIELQMMDYISGRMTPEEMTKFDQLIAQNPSYSQDLLELKEMVRLMEQHDQVEIPKPSAQMDESFYTMLQAQTEAQNTKPKNIWQPFKTWFQLPQIRKVVYGFSFMFLGVFLGHYTHLLNGQSDLEAERLAIKDQQIQALTVLSLLDMPSANKRLMAVNLASMSDHPNDSVVEALLMTLKQDSNVNVRLEALEVLAQHTELGSVRSGLVQAIHFQDSPMVQVAMANLMLQMNEEQAVEPIRKLLEQPEIIEPVRVKLNETVNELI